jgi:hypothetical protein
VLGTQFDADGAETLTRPADGTKRNSHWALHAGAVRHKRRARAWRQEGQHTALDSFEVRAGPQRREILPVPKFSHIKNRKSGSPSSSHGVRLYVSDRQLDETSAGQLDAQ